MARKEVSKTATTTIVVSKLLMNRVGNHVKNNEDDNQTKFITRALVNQLEKEGDFEIRSLLEEEREGEDEE